MDEGRGMKDEPEESLIHPSSFLREVPMTQEFDAELRALIALHLVPGLGPRLTAALLEHFGSAQNVLEAPASELRQVPYLGGALADTLAQTVREAEVDAEIERIRKHDVRLLVLGRPDYPPLLAEIHNP